MCAPNSAVSAPCPPPSCTGAGGQLQDTSTSAEAAQAATDMAGSTQQQQVHQQTQKPGCLVGVSLGHSPMQQPALARALLRWLAAHGYYDVAFAVCDTLAQFNEHVFNRKNLATGCAARAAERAGERVAGVLQQAAADVAAEHAQQAGCNDSSAAPLLRVRVLRWQEVHTPEYDAYIARVWAEYEHAGEEGGAFRERLHRIAAAILDTRSRHANAERLDLMSKYVAWELPLLTRGLAGHPDFVYPRFQKAGGAPDWAFACSSQGGGGGRRSGSSACGSSGAESNGAEGCVEGSTCGTSRSGAKGNEAKNHVKGGSMCRTSRSEAESTGAEDHVEARTPSACGTSRSGVESNGAERHVQGSTPDEMLYHLVTDVRAGKLYPRLTAALRLGEQSMRCYMHALFPPPVTPEDKPFPVAADREEQAEEEPMPEILLLDG